MPSTELRRSLRVAIVVLAMAAPAFARQEPSAVPVHSAEAIQRALESVKTDPNLGAEQVIRMLRWRDAGQPKPSNAAWFRWVRGLFQWIMQSGRYLMWAVLVILAAWLVVYLTRAVRGRAAAGKSDTFVSPTHVRDLDIRPESLPANIGHAARERWDRGDHRAALSLLYRGLLSRLTHVHRVPITDSSTEGDCLSLMTGRVSPKTHQYSTRLVDAWRDFVYGGADQPADRMHALCDEFAGALDRRVTSAAGGAE